MLTYSHLGLWPIFRHETACNNRYRLGCFVLAFMFPKVRGTAVFSGMLAGEAAIFATAYFTDVSWLWYNVIGCVVVMAIALGITYAAPGTTPAMPDRQPRE